MDRCINKRAGRLNNMDEIWINTSDLTVPVEVGMTYPVLCWERYGEFRQSVIDCVFLRWTHNTSRTDPKGQAVFGLRITHG